MENNVKQAVKVICKIAAYGTLVMLPRVLNVEIVSGNHDYESVGYHDAVRAILESGMFASDKREAISVMKRNGGEEYYKSVISIIKTGMFSGDKIEMIRML